MVVSLRKILFIIFIFTPILSISSDLYKPATEAELEKCPNIEDKKSLLGGWYLWEPYQYTKMTKNGPQLSGMDIDFISLLSQKVGVNVNSENVVWRQHVEDIQNGTRDVAAGATFTSARAEFALFSLPYRYEENSLFALKDSTKVLSFSNITEFLGQVRVQNYKLGVIDGFVYADNAVNEFIADPLNASIIKTYNNDDESLQGLLRGEIEGFLADRVVGAAAIMQAGVGDQVHEIKLNIKTPIHLMFSKKTVSIAMVERFNDAIKDVKGDADYNAIVKQYLYPVLLLQTINATWFYVVGVIGTIAFAVSGVAIAAKENTTLFGALILAMLPSVGGGVMRDVILNLDKVGLMLNPSYLYYVVITVMIGFAIIRLLNYYNKEYAQDEMVSKVWSNILTLGDAMGQAAFVVTGVAITIMGKIDPIQLWGAFFAFLTANGGGILRDLLRKERNIEALSGEVNAEISIFWGFIFASFLEIVAHDPDPDMISYAVIITITGAFLTRLGTHYFKVPNLRVTR